MTEAKERKSNLLTIRITDDDANAVEFMSDGLGKSRSDTVIRACKFFLSVNDKCTKDDFVNDKKKERKTQTLHLRMTDSDFDALNKRSQEIGVNVSQIIRKAIKKYASTKRGHY